MDTRYESSRKPNKCPACHAATVAPILYGMPDFSPELKRDREARRAVLGGCCVTEDDPEWECTACEARIYRKGGKA